MKYELEMEKIDNGFVVDLNGRKTFIDDRKKLADLILGSDAGKIDVQERLGRVQKDILRIVGEDRAMTVAEVAEKLYPGYEGRKKKNVQNSVNHSFKALQRRGLLKKGTNGKYRAS